MGLFDAFDISASALTAERLRMDVTAENLANAQTTRTPQGGAYRRKEVVLQQIGGESSFGTALSAAMGGAGGPAGGVKAAAIVEDSSPGKKVYDPSHPDADKQGYVTMPNVDTVTEMVDLIGSSRSYEANVTALQDSKQMFSHTLDLLR
jgi:flagellar basal-body rod protein FlgC